MLADDRLEVLRDGAHASAHHANVLGFVPTVPIAVAAGNGPARTSKTDET
jgi:hypothetical protein